MEVDLIGCDNNTPLLETIRRTIEERNLLTTRSRMKFNSAFRRACLNDTLSRELAIERRIENLKSRVIQELISSEKSYLKQIGWIVTEFKLTLEVHSVLQRKDMDLLFGNIELIKTLNQELFKELGSSQGSISKAFQKFAPMLKIYSAYARNYQQGIETLQSIQVTNPEAMAIINEKEMEINSKLSALLIIPIQRIPRYKLLLEQLVSLSKKDEVDVDIQQSLETINGVAHHMNEMVRSFENTQKILELRKYFRKRSKLELIKPGRILIKNGIVSKPPKNHRRYLIVFDDELIFCKVRRGSKLRLHAPLVVPLRKCIVNLNGNAIIIHSRSESVLTFNVANTDDLNDWYEVISQTIDNLRLRSATLRKESSARTPSRKPRREVIASASSSATPQQNQPSDTPGRLKRVFNISSCLDEIVDFLSPKKKKQADA